ncbi:MAG: hypothetical protein GX577_11665 [Leptolinea sp.]|nr:hypothetical protein [Leptolinea sp.]
MSISTITPSTVNSGSIQTSNPVTNLSVETREINEEKTLEAGSQISGVSSFAMAMRLSELSLTSTTTQFHYRSDNSLAIKAHSNISFQARTEEFRFDVTMSAESLGLTRVDFMDASKPMTIQLTYSQSQLQVSQKISIKEIQTLRKPEEIIQDLVKALTDVFKDPGNKTVSYVLDSEAIQSLTQSDPKLARLFGELVMIMAMVNLMKRQGEERNDYTIFLSGKGKPYLDIQEEIDGELVSQTYQFNITVEPPSVSKTDTIKALEPAADAGALSENVEKEVID